MSEIKQVKVTLVRSLAKKLQNHQACVRGLGLRRMHQTVVIAATPENMGMVRKASYLLKVEEV
nr:50S ribosomal protein L30 [Sinimarinibacterium sp. NLF-5-8]